MQQNDYKNESKKRKRDSKVTESSVILYANPETEEENKNHIDIFNSLMDKTE